MWTRFPGPVEVKESQKIFSGGCFTVCWRCPVLRCSVLYKFSLLLNKVMGFISRHSLFRIIAPQVLVFLGHCNWVFIILLVRSCLFIGLLSVLPTSKSLHHTTGEWIPVPRAAKSRKSLLVLSRQIALFMINSLSVLGAVLCFHAHFPSILVTSSFSVSIKQPWNNIFTDSNRMSNTENGHWCVLFKSYNYSFFHGCNIHIEGRMNNNLTWKENVMMCTCQTLARNWHKLDGRWTEPTETVFTCSRSHSWTSTISSKHILSALCLKNTPKLTLSQ